MLALWGVIMHNSRFTPSESVEASSRKHRRFQSADCAFALDVKNFRLLDRGPITYQLRGAAHLHDLTTNCVLIARVLGL